MLPPSCWVVLSRHGLAGMVGWRLGPWLRRPQTIALLYAVATAWGRIGVAAPEIPLKSLSIRIPDYQRAWLDARRRPHQPISALFRDLLDTAMLQDDGASIPTTPAGRDQ